VIFARKEKADTTTNQIFSSNIVSLTQAIDESKAVTIKNLKLSLKVYTASVEALAKEKKNAVAKALETVQQLRLQSTKIQNKIIKYVKKMPKGNLPASRLYILMFDYMQDLYQSIQLISENCIDHLSNFHSQPSKDYLKTSASIEKGLNEYVTLACELINIPTVKGHEKIVKHHQNLLALINKSIDQSIGEIQNAEVGNRIGMLQMRLLLETKDILITIHHMYDLYYDYHKQDQ
jgi:hypothetical protein